MKTAAEVRKETEAAIAKAVANCNPDWQFEMGICAFIAATENAAIQIDDVWRVFHRRGSGLTTHNRMAAGGIMRLAKRAGWIEPARRPPGVLSLTNHNPYGTGYWRSLIHEPGARVPDSFMRFEVKEPEQIDLFAMEGI
jgi:hypothetical protein